ncbi:hypothetical protein, partial [Nocardioides sp.]|uniref:hypothetical protein n=1 Tax=Nocardioides sp. TaxID=35761 RepID=UPI002B266590
MTAAPLRDCILHLRCLDTDVRVEFAGSGAPDLFAKARKAWSRCLAEPSDTAVHRLVLVTDSEAEQRAKR